MNETRLASTLIRVWNKGSLTLALRAAADLIDNNAARDHIVEHVYTEYDDQGWAVNIVIGKELPSVSGGNRQYASRGRRVYDWPDPYDRPDGGPAGESQQEYLGIR